MEPQGTPLLCCAPAAPQEVELQEEAAVALEVETLPLEQREVLSRTTAEGQGAAVDLIIFLIQAPLHQATPV